jgi:hypothetical protein
VTTKINTKLAMIDDFLIDCVLNEEHTFESEVTEYPVEDGADITDNVRPKPIVVTMDCIISNTPLPPISSLRGPRDDGTAFSLLSATRGVLQVTPAQEAYQRMMIIRNAREPVTIRTSLDTFKNMVLKNLTIPRASGSGDALRFTASWQQVEIITNVRGTRVAIPGAKTGTSKNKPPAPTKQKFFITDPYDGTWFDPDINGWREGASFNPKTGRWEFFKGRPIHIDQQRWQSGEFHPTDAEVRQINENGVLPPGTIDKNGKVNQNLAQQVHLVTDPASIDAARNAGVTDQWGNPLNDIP